MERRREADRAGVFMVRFSVVTRVVTS
jgi:hypothetical protein